MTARGGIDECKAKSGALLPLLRALQTRRTPNVVWHDENLLDIHPHYVEERNILEGTWMKLANGSGDTASRAHVTDRVAPGVVYTTFHHPEMQADVATTDFSDWATNCSEYKCTAVQVSRSNGRTEWQEDYRAFAKNSRRIAPTEAAD